MFNEEFLEKYLKFDDNVGAFVAKSGGKVIWHEIKKFRNRKPIPSSVITEFYDQPNKFFSEYQRLLENTTYIDNMGNTIFSHYFYILYEKSQKKNSSAAINFDIYEKNFDTFFKENEKYLLVQDINLDIPLLKLIKLRDKSFFIEIYDRLNKLKLIGNELLLCSNITGQNITTYIIDEIKYNSEKIRYADFYYKFLKDNYSIYENAPDDDKKILKKFMSKVIFDIRQYKEDNFNEIFNNINGFVNDNIQSNIFEYIHCPYNANINYLNSLFSICSKPEDYDKLYNLITILSKKTEIINKINFSQKCIIDHIGYVLRKMNSYKRKGEYEMDYASKLIKGILIKYFKKNNKNEIAKIFGNGKRFKKGLLIQIENNTSLSFAKKCEFLDLFSEITSELSYLYINNKDLLNYYNFFKFDKNKNGKYMKEKNYLESLDLICKENAFYINLLTIFYEYNSKEVGNTNEKGAKFLREFLDKYHYNTLKNKYNFSDEEIEKILVKLESKFDDNSEVKQNKAYKKMEKDFIMSDEKLMNKALERYLGNEIIIEYLDIILSYPNDLSKTIFDNISKIMDLIHNYIYSRISENEDENEEEIDKRLKQLNIFSDNLPLLKGKSFEAEYYALYILLSNALDEPKILFPKKKSANFIQTIKYFNKRNWNKIIKNINGDFDFSEVVNLINRNILVFCKLYKGKTKMFLGIIEELVPNLNLNVYKKVMELVEQYSSNDHFEHKKDDQFPEEVLNELFVIMILLFIKKKFEKDNPNLVIFLLTHMIKFDYCEIIKLFNDSFNANNINNIFDNFIFEEFSYNTEKFKVLDYLKQNQASIFETLKALRHANYIIYKNYLTFIRPNLKGFIYCQNGNIPELKDFQEYYNIKSQKFITLIFHLDLSKTSIKYNAKKSDEDEEKEKEDNFNFILNKISSNQISILTFFDVNQKQLNKNIFIKYVSIIENLVKDTKNTDFETFDCNFWKFKLINKDIIINLYEFLQCKNEKNKLFDLSDNHKFISIILIDFFTKILKDLNKNSLNKEKKKIEYIKNEIYEYMKNKNNEYYKNYFVLSHETPLIDYTNSIVNKIKKLKDRNSIENEISEFRSLLSTYNGTFHRCFFNQFTLILGILLEKSEEIFYDFLNLLYNVYKVDFDFFNLSTKLMSKCLDKFVNCFPQIISEYKTYCEKKNKCLRISLEEGIKKYIIKYIFKNKKYNLLDHSNLASMNIINSLDSCLLLLNSIDNKDGNKFIFNKIKKSFCSDENTLFIEFIQKAIKNQYVFDIIFKTVYKKKDKNFFENNKKKFIRSLYKYSERNEYYYIDQLLKYMNIFMSLDEIKGFIYPPYSEKNRTNIFDDGFIDDLINNNDEKSKYLFTYVSSLGKCCQNYETLIVLLNYCEKERALLDLFPFFYYPYETNMDLNNMYYMSFFSNAKNKDKIKSLNKFMYDFSLLLEFIYKQQKYIESLTKFEKDIFYYYIEIIVLQITPPILFRKYIKSNDNYELNEIIEKMQNRFNKIKICSELESCIIFALYEIKGTTLIPIAKYFPEFYLKIENICKTFKSLKIPEICLKQSLDVKFYDNFIYSLKNNQEELISLFYDNRNLIFIIEKEFGNLLAIEGKSLYLQKIFYNLVNNNKILPFMDNNEKAEQFFYGLEHYACNPIGRLVYNEENNFSKESIFSLKDFNRSSSILIQKCVDDFKNTSGADYCKKKFYLLEYYIYYLEELSSICNYILLNSKSNDESIIDNKEKNKKDKKNINNNIEEKDIFILKDLLFQNNNSIFTALKNSININQIKFYIINAYKKLSVNEMKYFDLFEKWIDYYLKQNQIAQILNDTEMTFLKYINYLNASCSSIIQWLFKIKEIILLNKEEQKYQLRFIEETKKESAIKNFGKNLYNLGQAYIDLRKKDENNDGSNFNQTISIYYYFDENIGDYVETSTGNVLFPFIYGKMDDISQIIFPNNNYNESYIREELYKINTIINTKNIKLLLKDYFSFPENLSEDYEKLLTNMMPIFEKFIERNKNFIQEYLQISAPVINLSSGESLLQSITNKMKDFIEFYILPLFYLNLDLYNYYTGKNYMFYTLSNINNENKIYVDLSKLILDIMNTKFNKDKNLDELFKIKAINYILNDDSLLRNFIDELCSRVTDFFSIKIVKGKSYGKSDFKKLKKVVDEDIQNDLMLMSYSQPKSPKKQKKVKYKLKTGETKEQKNNNFHFAVFKRNLFKRENIPNLYYSGHIPLLNSSVELSRASVMEQAFGNEYMVVRKQENNFFIGNEKNQRMKGKKPKELNAESFVNPYDLIYTVKSIAKNEITLSRNDISTILDQYSSPGALLALLNHNFPLKKERDVVIDINMITKYIKENY